MRPWVGAPVGGGRGVESALLEKVGENLACGSALTVVEAERSEVLAAPAPGERLEAGLAADQQWREERKQKLRRELRRAYLLGAAGPWACAAAGLTELVFWLALIAFVLNPDAYAGWGVALYFGLLCGSLALLAPGVVLTLMGAVAQRRLLKRAKREAVEIAPAKTPTFPEPLPRCTGWRDRARETAEAQYAIDYNEAVGRSLRGACLFCAGASWIAVLLALLAFVASAFVASILHLWELAWWWAIIPALLAPLPALGSVFTWFRGKRLLHTAARERLEVRAPAASPWE